MRRTAMSEREGAALLAVSYRQMKRLWRRFRTEGAAGLVHRSVGQPSHHAHGLAEKAQVLQIVAAQYGGTAARGAGQRLGPTLAAEYLARAHRRCRNVTPVDAGGGVVESDAGPRAASDAACAAGAIRRAGTARWQFSRVV
jgi:hypothetical protein